MAVDHAAVAAPGPATVAAKPSHDDNYGMSASLDGPASPPFVNRPLSQLMDRTSGDIDSSGDETTALARRVRGGKRSYNTRANDPSRLSVGTQDATGERNVRAGAAPPQDQPAEPQLSWWQSVVDKYGTIELENKGSVARDHLALERTFLAWLRTSLSFASIGVAVTQLFRLNQTIKNPDAGPNMSKIRHVGKPVGATFLAVGILTLIIGFHRYFESQHYVRLGKFPASRASITLIALVTAALMFASLVVILSIKPAAVE